MERRSGDRQRRHSPGAMELDWFFTVVKRIG
jgi:hypothetical protein